MTFNPQIPQSANIPSQSQGEMLTNFQQLNIVFDVDHVPFDDSTAANRGKHDKSTYIELSASPGTAANEVAVYSKAVGGVTRLFLQQEGLAPAGADIQLSGANPTAAASGSTFLPGGLILKWGVLTAPIADNDPVVFAGGAFPTAVFSVTLTAGRASTTVRSLYVSDGTLLVGGFDIRTSGSSFTNVYYMAIGN